MTLFGVNHAAEEGLAAVGAVLRSIQLIPQIHKSYKTKSTHGLSSAFMLVWACTQLALGPYTIVQQLAIPLQIQPQAFAFFSAVSWAQCLHYGRGLSTGAATACLVTLLSVLAGAEVGSVFGLRAGRAAGTEVPVQVYGYLTWLRTFLSAPPQFYKIYKFREVAGISYMFMSIDIVGAIFSILSLLFRAELDIPAIVTFALVVVQNGLVIICALILNPRAERRRAQEAALAPPSPSSDEPKSSSIVDEESALEDRYRAMQQHKGSVSSNITMVGDGKEKDFSRTTTLEVEDISKSGWSTPSAGGGRSRAPTLVDLPGLKEEVSRSEEARR